MYRIIGADQKEYGPVTGDAVRQWISERRLHTGSLARTEGLTDWKPLWQFPEFSSVLPSGHAPFPAGPSPLLVEQRTNSMATAGLVTSCLAFICCGGCGPLAILGIVFSIIGLNQANRDPAQTGKGVAIAGLVVGIISILGAVVGAIATVGLGAAGALFDALNR